MYHPAEAPLAGSEKPVNSHNGSHGQAGAGYQLESATLAVGTHCNWEGYQSSLNMSKGVVWVELHKHHTLQDLTTLIIR